MAGNRGEFIFFRRTGNRYQWFNTFRTGYAKIERSGQAGQAGQAHLAELRPAGGGQFIASACRKIDHCMAELVTLLDFNPDEHIVQIHALHARVLA